MDWIEPGTIIKIDVRFPIEERDEFIVISYKGVNYLFEHVKEDAYKFISKSCKIEDVPEEAPVIKMQNNVRNKTMNELEVVKLIEELRALLDGNEMIPARWHHEVIDDFIKKKVEQIKNKNKGGI